jgi:hypothetical protein
MIIIRLCPASRWPLLIIVCLTLIIGLASTNSCKKDNKIRGCTDKDSKNYNGSAQEDDGSCLYEGQAVNLLNKFK